MADESSHAESLPEDEESVDSFLRAAARIPEESEGARAEHEAARLREGVVVGGRYRLDRELGEGGMGIVWAAEHTVTRRPFALKFLKGSIRLGSEHRARFVREARVATAIDHPNVVGVLDVFELDDGTPVMVMDRLFGETLGRRLAREGRLSPEQLAALLVPVVSAVGMAHSLGIVHRDLKPENIFVLENAAVKVLDFGVAKLADSAKDLEDALSTGTGALLGTACYMSPEQALAEKDVDHRADLWALGVIMYECLSGERPVKSASVGQVVFELMSGRISPLTTLVPELPVDLADVVGRCLSRGRSSRPASAREVLDVIERYTAVRAPAFGAPMPSLRAAAGEETSSERARFPSDPPVGPVSVARAPLPSGGTLNTSELGARTGARPIVARARTALALITIAGVAAGFVALREHRSVGEDQAGSAKEATLSAPIDVGPTRRDPPPAEPQPVPPPSARPEPATAVATPLAPHEAGGGHRLRKVTAAPAGLATPVPETPAVAVPAPEPKPAGPTVAPTPTVGKGLAEHVPF